MRRVVLQPAASIAAQRHYVDTIDNPVQFVEHAGQLRADELDELHRLYPSAAAPLWGATPGVSGGNVAPYERIDPGDFVFFSGGGRLFAGGTITYRFRNPALARRLWGVDDRTGQTWELMFAVDELRSFDLPYAEMNRVVGYAATNVVQGFTVLSEERSAALFDFLDLDSDAHPAAVDTADFIGAITFDGETEREVTRSQRLEQSYLRRQLLHGAAHAPCALCGRDLPAEFLIAAHIKKRAACTTDERRDIGNIAMLACKFGCDALYEQGYLGVASDGRLITSPRLLEIQSMGRNFDQWRERTCDAHDDGSAIYFDWHLRNTFRDELRAER